MWSGFYLCWVIIHKERIRKYYGKPGGVHSYLGTDTAGGFEAKLCSIQICRCVTVPNASAEPKLAPSDGQRSYLPGSCGTAKCQPEQASTSSVYFMQIEQYHYQTSIRTTQGNLSASCMGWPLVTRGNSCILLFCPHATIQLALDVKNHPCDLSTATVWMGAAHCSDAQGRDSTWAHFQPVLQLSCRGFTVRWTQLLYSFYLILYNAGCFLSTLETDG